MKMPIKNVSIISTIILLIASVNLQAAKETSPNVPFNNRIIFSETPEIGHKWHPGIRNKDILCWDVYWNINDWLTIDVLQTGLSNIKIKDNENGGEFTLTDKFTLFTIKSRPFETTLMKYPYKLSIGLAIYSTISELYNPIISGYFKLDTFAQAGLFVTQSLNMKNRKWWIFDGSHYFNLLTSFQSHNISDSTSFTSWYIIPGYRFLFNHPRNLSFDFEYYFMNPYELPIKTLQIITDPDHLPFENPNRNFVSFMFYGFSFSWKHARVELHLGHHYSFNGPIIPMLGFGWDF